MFNAITDVRGIRVGHTTLPGAATGCTVVLCDGGAVGGVDVRGSAPGTRETDLLRPGNLVQQVHGVLLSGGSAFGLDAAAGVMRYLEEQGVGFTAGQARVPIVPAAILFDLGVITHRVRPGPEEGYQACLNAASGAVAEGSVGAGTGATVGKTLGLARAAKGGVGTASLMVQDRWVVGALVAVNALGDVVDPETGQVLAGPRREDGQGFYRSTELIISGRHEASARLPTNTSLVVVATDASLTKEQANKLAQMAHDGLALAIRPCHMMGDGDVAFALATGRVTEPVSMNALCAATVAVVARAVVRSVTQATALGGIPAVRQGSAQDTPSSANQGNAE